MKDDTTFTGLDNTDFSEIDGVKPEITYTQVASCAVGENNNDRRRQTLRARLEREQYERDQQTRHSFINTFRNLFTSTGH